MTEDAREVVVMGRAEADVMPDRAGLRITVAADGADRAGAYAEAARIAHEVDTALDALVAALERRTVTAIVVQPRTRLSKGESRTVGWRAARTTIVEIDPAGVSELVASVAARAELEGPWWIVSPDNPVHDTARRAAGTDARRRATAYAEALGCAVGEVAWIREPEVAGPAHRFRTGMHAAAAAAAMPEHLDVAPDEVTVAAAVQVAFRLG